MLNANVHHSIKCHHLYRISLAEHRNFSWAN
jgi:hypothetical protein